MQAVDDERRRQRYISVLCRFPEFYRAIIVYDPDDLVEHKKRCISLHRLKRLTRVLWEDQALRRRGGYDKEENNVYDPKRDVAEIKGEPRQYAEFKFPSFYVLILGDFASGILEDKMQAFMKSLSVAVEQLSRRLIYTRNTAHWITSLTRWDQL